MIHNDEGKAPAFQLINAGFDVWLGNSRGNKYSLGHTQLDHTNDRMYWQFSFIEMGQYDSKAFVDYIIKTTGRFKVTVIAHSQGASQMIYSLDTFPRYWENRVNALVALAPITRFHHSKDVLFDTVTKDSNFQAMSQMCKENSEGCSFLGQFPTATQGTSLFCQRLPEVCESAREFKYSSKEDTDDPESLKRYMEQ